MQKIDPTVQFMPFDALKGFKEEIKNKENEKVEFSELTNDEEEYLNNIITEIEKKDRIEVIFYTNGNYYKIDGIVSNIDYVFKTITIVKKKIPFNIIKNIKIINKYDL